MRSHLDIDEVNAAQGSSPVVAHLEELYRKYLGSHEGRLADYIPELAKADPNSFGICLVTTGGYVYEVGDSRQGFSIQSISKPFIYGMALEDNGRADVMKKIGVEPSGDAFNAISLDPATGRPFNPMINAGAIATVSLIAGKSARTRLDRMLRTLALCAGRELAIDEAVYRSESETGHRNRAIGHLLRNFDIIKEDPTPIVDLYFKQCSVSVTCRDLAVMAATLANHGLNPVTGKQAMRGEYVESVLSVMGSCGMYDFAGEWIYKVGMPAKSGVSGGIIAVLPGQLGIGVYSPLVDPHGNSVRGIRVCEDLSRYLDLHLFNAPHASEAAIRLSFSGAQINSSRLRTTAESAVISEFGSAIRLYELQGRMVFTTAEVVVRDVTRNAEHIEFLILDFKRVISINESACWLFVNLLASLSERGKEVLFTHAGNASNLRRFVKTKFGDRADEVLRVFADNDLALEWCEDQLIERKLAGRNLHAAVPVADYELFQGLAPEEFTVVEALLERRTYRKGDVIINFGDEARDIFFLARGSVSIHISLPSGKQRRLATLSPTMTFGEMAAIDGARRSAIVIADSEAECDSLKVEDFNRLIDSHPRIKIVMLKNLNLALCRKLRKANRELAVFD